MKNDGQEKTEMEFKMVRRVHPMCEELAKENAALKEVYREFCIRMFQEMASDKASLDLNKKASDIFGELLAKHGVKL